MMLGELLVAARRSSDDFLCWLDGAEAELAASLREAAERADEHPATYLRVCVGSFTNEASEEDWATLSSRLRDAEDPAMTCLDVMARWRIAIDRTSSMSGEDDEQRA